MKFSIERAVLLKAVAQAQSVVERRNTIPILANVLIEAEGDDVHFRATDLDIEVVDKAPAKVERAGATTVSAVTLNEIVRKLPDGALVTLTEDGASGRLTIEAGRSNFSLATLPKEDFPVMASSEYAANFSAPAPILRRLFDKSKFAISTEETRYYLNGVYMHVSDSEGGKVLRCVATDGHRLARIDADLPDGASDMAGVIVPRKTVGELRKLLDDDDMQIAVSVSETKVRFATPDITLTSKVIDGTFP
ncbi:MAG: DNA polymerase III subunit beta, partial [Pseudomonadota bacterium]